MRTNREDGGGVSMDEFYGNNSLSGFQQREAPEAPEVKEEYEKGLLDVIKDKLRKRGPKDD